MQIERLLLACRPGDLVFATEVALFVHGGDVLEQSDALDHHLLYGFLLGGRVDPHEDLVALDLRVLLGERSWIVPTITLGFALRAMHLSGATPDARRGSSPSSGRGSRDCPPGPSPNAHGGARHGTMVSLGKNRTVPAVAGGLQL